MKTKELQVFIAKWIMMKRGHYKTQKQFAAERGINQKTLNKHESFGVLRFDVLVKYIDSDEEMLYLFRKYKS